MFALAKKRKSQTPNPTQYCATRYGRLVKSSQNEEDENEAQSAESDDPEYQDQDHETLEENDYDGNSDLDTGKIYFISTIHINANSFSVSILILISCILMLLILVQVKKEPVNEAYVEDSNPGKTFQRSAPCQLLPVIWSPYNLTVQTPNLTYPMLT